MKKIKLFFTKAFAKIEWFFNLCYEGFFRFFRKHYLLICFFIIFSISLIVRLSFLYFVSGDMKNALLKWFSQIKNNGNFAALKNYPWDGMSGFKEGDYPVAYINLLVILSYLPIKDIYAIKLLSILFDYVLAFGVILILRLFNKNKFFLLVSFTLLVFFPTSILNSAVWGQADQMYVALVVWALYLILTDKRVLSLFLIGFAVALKIQTIFFFPVLIFLWFNKKFKLRSFFVIFFAVFLTFIPSYLAGAKFSMPFEMYKLQITSLYKNANYGSGSIYAFFEFAKLYDGINNGAGVAFAILVVGVVLLFLFHYKVRATRKNIIYVAVLFSLVTPFVLPHMHERYFYMADVFVILYVLVFKRKYLLALLMSFSSTIAYTHFLTGSYIFKFLETDSVRLAAIINLVIIIIIALDGRKVIEKEEEPNKQKNINLVA